jgi:hypothetical protein
VNLMLLKVFTLAHVGVSLAGIAAGCTLLLRMAGLPYLFGGRLK